MKNIKNKWIGKLVLGMLVCWLCGCVEDIRVDNKEAVYPELFPDYKFVTVPVNMAPLNFRLKEGCEKMQVHFRLKDKTELVCEGKERGIDIPLKAWRTLLDKAKGAAVSIQVYRKQSGEWTEYLPFDIHVAADPIDPYIAYRLIEPGYEKSNRMGIYQRDLSSFDESVIIRTDLTGGCVNCHSFSDYNPDRFMFHARFENGGTFVARDGKLRKSDMKTAHTPSAGAYPMWHPSGDYIVFSSNLTRQAFHALKGKKIEVYDLESDLMLYDVKNDKVILDRAFVTKNLFETFPAWSPDGSMLYFCRAEAQEKLPMKCEELKYGIYCAPFDPATGCFGQIDTLIDPGVTQKSASFPRISPDGRYLMYTQSDYATFPLWHKEADLKLIDLQTRQQVDIALLNSGDAESYHSWSSDGRWVVFSSRRLDGLYTRLFIAYFDREGKMHKPFLLPQRECDFYDLLMDSYNVPEFVKGKVELSPYEIEKILKGKSGQPEEYINN